MKKLTILLVVVLISLSAFCQKLDNPFYFRFGYSNPSWKYFGFDKEAWGTEVNKYGVNFEIGTIFMLQTIPKPENISLGINVDYLYVNYNNFKLSSANGDNNLGIYRLGSKIGPSFTYSPIEKMAFDIYVKADLAWGAIAVPNDDGFDEGDDYFLDLFSVGISAGLNFRYDVLMLGIEFNTINPELESDDSNGVYFQELLEGLTGKGDKGKKSELPNVNFTIGLNF